MSLFDPAHGCNLYLARQTTGMQVEIVDGGHDGAAGVARAAKLHERVFGRGKKSDWLMVEIHELPAIDAAINEEAASACAKLVRGSQIKTSRPEGTT